MGGSSSSPQHFVYILKSLQPSGRPYVGLTSNVPARLAAHNAGLSPHTARHRPWRVVVCIEFEDEKRARAFERYLKSGSGWAFSRRHFL
ncbi:MAG: GIY-YIG nuclease family protein [Bacteroidales bacterium]